MRPSSRILVVAMLLPAACSDGGSPTSAVSPTSSAESVILPAGVPPTYSTDHEPGDLPFEELVPGGAELTGTWFPGRDTVIVTWGAGDDPLRREQGLVVWRRTGSDPPWLATYAFRDPPRAGILGIEVDTADVTGDGEADAVVFENAGGSGACGTWRVLALAPEADAETYERDLCDASVEISADPVGIRVLESVYGPEDPHCCPSGMRTTTVEWNGARWRVTSTSRADAG